MNLKISTYVSITEQRYFSQEMGKEGDCVCVCVGGWGGGGEEGVRGEIYAEKGMTHVHKQYK